MGGGNNYMKKSLYVFIGIILSFLFINIQPAHANIFDNIIVRSTPTPTPTPTPKFQIVNPALIDKIKLIETATPTLEPKLTVTPTPVVIVVTATPTVQANESIAPTQDAKATDAGNTVTTPPTASNAANAQTGLQTKDIVTYILIGAILLVLLVQAFMPKKGAKPEAKSEEPKAE